MTYRQYLESLPALSGFRPDGTPIEDVSEIAIGERGHFFTLSRAAAETERIEAMLPEGVEISGPTPTLNNYGYKLTGDSAKLKRYDIVIDGHTYDLGTIVGFVSTYPGFKAEVSNYGMAGKLEPAEDNPSGIYLKFTPAPEVKPPQVAPPNVPPFPAPAGQEWVMGMIGWALMPKVTGYSEAQINDILERVEKALRG